MNLSDLTGHLSDLAATPKRRRSKLAKSELLIVLASAAESLQDYSSQTIEIADRYGLDDDDIKRILHGIGNELETRAMKVGFEEAWSPTQTIYDLIREARKTVAISATLSEARFRQWAAQNGHELPAPKDMKAMFGPWDEIRAKALRP